MNDREEIMLDAPPATTLIAHRKALEAAGLALQLSDTVPAGTTFNAGASTAGWVCVPGPGAGSVCTLAIGGLAPGA